MRAAAALLVTLCVAGASVRTDEAQAGILIRVDKTTQRMTVTRDGQTLYDWPVSTGMDGYSTPRGAFSPSRMVVDYRSREWDDAPMPHAIFFTGRGHAIHGSNHTSRLGTPASHGCVRLAPGKAATLYALVKAEGMGNTRVVIGGDETVLAGRTSPRREARARRERLDEDGYAQAGYAQPGYAQAPRVARRRSSDPWGNDGWQPVGATYPSPYGATYYSYGPSY
ncbi:L,D-transpeptidase catalytic domain [Methylobacterium sp. 174MFSha1.1]|uniref:L,D-transpeptidase n=1 Tax=Methylobacterium sp. 174MFSha1.1 TaxID=1502749 RepID=UPI0008E3D608|nr:L,D-transpeptidase [Methylobacterium sp. 174MFSha1.1]SFV16451.1 L,D-transpeptidase catalytic domain [Methylobacterium sp. 174MFSha1.1]